jgi:type I restriction-modification system DNA methylase subunit
LFFIAFNKYTGKADKNQAFTPDHITDFMARLTEVDRTKVVLDATCGSGSFLVQAMVKELADCRRDTTEAESKDLMKIVKQKHIF